MATDSIRGRTAVVTGASSGIGRAIADALVRAGARVAGFARRRDRLDSIEAELGDGFVPVTVDLRSEASIATGFETAVHALGGVDILVNNAGLGHNAPLVDGDPAAWREMLEVNVLALCICTRHAIGDMNRRGAPGHIVHVSSMSAHRVPPGSGVYSATKFAVRSLTEGLRQELHERGSDIRVTAISPGFVETEFAEKYHHSRERAAETYGRYKVLDSADIAAAVLYALSQPAHVQVHDILMRPTKQPR